jgi:D-3-phosphoglycerate dehydrogenase / 2-oxoglutarate reductase
MKKILITPSSFGQCGYEPLDILRKAGYDAKKNPYGRKLTEDETIELSHDVVGIIAGVENYNKNVLDNIHTVKCISRVGVGMDSIDIPYAESKGISVVNTPDGPTQAVAELSIGLAMNLLRRISISDRRIRGGVWKKEVGNLIQGKKVGIIGLGRIGKRASGLFKALGCEVIATDKYFDVEWAKEAGVSEASMEELLRDSDIISIHIPGMPKGEYLIGSDELLMMKKEVIIINLARGGIVNESALFDHLSKNENSFAACDVFDTEPYNGPLAKLDNSVLTPHLGSYATEGKLNMEIDAVWNLINILSK